MLQSMGSQRVGCDLATERQQQMTQLRPSLSFWGEASGEGPPRVSENKPLPLPWEEAGRQDCISLGRA